MIIFSLVLLVSVSERLKSLSVLHWATKRYFCLLAQVVGAFLGYIGVAKSENALSFAELARVFEITSLAKLQNCKNIQILLQ